MSYGDVPVIKPDIVLMLKYVSPDVLIPCLTFDLSLVEMVIIGARMCPWVIREV